MVALLAGEHVSDSYATGAESAQQFGSHEKAGFWRGNRAEAWNWRGTVGNFADTGAGMRAIKGVALVFFSIWASWAVSVGAAATEDAPIRMNSLGYLPEAAKVATVASRGSEF